MSNVLVIEDDLSAQKIYIEKLKLVGVDVLSTVSGKEGLFYAREKRPDLIILDVMLGGDFNGFEVLTSLKKDPDLKSIPVLVLTNLDSEEKLAREIGATDYLVKANTGIEELTKKIKSYLVNTEKNDK